MSYEKIRKNNKGGKLIVKFHTPAGPIQSPPIPGSIVKSYSSRLDQILGDPNIDYATWSAGQRLKAGMQAGFGQSFDFNGVQTSVSQSEVGTFLGNYVQGQPGDDEIDTYEAEKEDAELTRLQQETPGKLEDAIQNVDVSEEERVAAEKRKAAGGGNNNNSLEPVQYNGNDDNEKARRMQKASIAMGVIGEAATAAINATDNALMGDKNFSAQSQTIDQAVHGVSGALMKSGNPYAMAAGVALEGINFITKAGGRTVPGFDVDINNSGYGNMGHMDSESGRIWDKWSGRTGRQLAKRNEQARMALAAQDVSQEQEYQQEARANSVTNVLQQNQIALAGGIDTSLLGN